MSGLELVHATPEVEREVAGLLRAALESAPLRAASATARRA